MLIWLMKAGAIPRELSAGVDIKILRNFRSSQGAFLDFGDIPPFFNFDSFPQSFSGSEQMG